MQDDRPIAVLILYSHPLFGDGLVEMLGRETGLDVSSVRVDDIDGVRRALVASPQVVIAERRAPGRAVELLEQVPDALIIDVGLGPGPTFAYRRDEISGVPESVVAAIRQASTRRSARRQCSVDPKSGVVARA